MRRTEKETELALRDMSWKVYPLPLFTPMGQNWGPRTKPGCEDAYKQSPHPQRGSLLRGKRTCPVLCGVMISVCHTALTPLFLYPTPSLFGQLANGWLPHKTLSSMRIRTKSIWYISAQDHFLFFGFFFYLVSFLSFFTFMLFLYIVFLSTALLNYNSHTIQFAHLKCTIQCI